MANATKTPLVTVGPAVVSFPDVFVAKMAPNKEMKRSVTLIFKAGDGQAKAIKPLKDAVQALLEEKFPDGKVPKNLKMPFRDGEEYSDKNGYEAGDIFVQFSRKESFGPIPVVGRQREEIQPSDVYPGCLGIVATKPYYWEHKETNKKGISFGLEAFQLFGDGERLGGAEPVDVDETFDSFDAVEE